MSVNRPERRWETTVAAFEHVDLSGKHILVVEDDRSGS